MKETLIHSGCGPIILPGWINVDIVNPAADIIADACHLDQHFKEGCASLCFSCHCIEHVPCERVPEFLRQCFRVLKTRGTLRLVLPDLKHVATKYLRGENLRDILVDGTQRFTGIHDTAAARFHYWMSDAFEHKMSYDFETLKILLNDAGFVGIRQMPFGHSDIPQLRGLDRFPTESMAVESSKP